ncbi:MAG: symporter small accessory protein [Phycisphaerae bacterium]
MLAFLGLSDPYILAAYLLCILSTVLCVIYGAICWNRGEETIDSEDVRWAEEEKKVEEEL